MKINVKKKALKEAWIDDRQPLALEFGKTGEYPIDRNEDSHHIFHWYFEGDPGDQTVITLSVEFDEKIKPCTINGVRKKKWGSKLVITSTIASSRKKKSGSQNIDYQY